MPSESSGMPLPSPESANQSLSPEELCLQSLLDMNDVNKEGKFKACNEFYTSLHGNAPDDLRTTISVKKPGGGNDEVSQIATQVSGRISGSRGSSESLDSPNVIAKIYASGMSESEDSGAANFAIIDFVKTEEGIKAYAKNVSFRDGKRFEEYGDELSESQLLALAADAKTIEQKVIEAETELLKLGPLTEEAGPDGLRKFHVGDILSAVTGRLLSARGVDGIYDILSYMTEDSVGTTQLARFTDECRPYLEQQFGEILGEYYKLPEGINEMPDLCRWLSEVAEATEGPFLTVKPIPEGKHVEIDFGHEVEMDLFLRE